MDLVSAFSNFKKPFCDSSGHILTGLKQSILQQSFSAESYKKLKTEFFKKPGGCVL